MVVHPVEEHVECFFEDDDAFVLWEVVVVYFFLVCLPFLEEGVLEVLGEVLFAGCVGYSLEGNVEEVFEDAVDDCASCGCYAWLCW